MTTLLRTLALAALLLACACSSVGLGDSGLVPGAGLPERGDCLVLQIDDALDPTGRPVPGSAARLSVALRKAFKAYGWEVLNTTESSLATGFDEAVALRCSLMLQAEFESWQEAGKDWTEQPDQVGLVLRLYRVADHALIAWGMDELAGGSLFDASESTHRLIEPLVDKLATPIFTGQELGGIPEPGL